MGEMDYKVNTFRGFLKRAGLKDYRDFPLMDTLTLQDLVVMKSLSEEFVKSLGIMKPFHVRRFIRQYNLLNEDPNSTVGLQIEKEERALGHLTLAEKLLIEEYIKNDEGVDPEMRKLLIDTLLPDHDIDPVLEQEYLYVPADIADGDASSDGEGNIAPQAQEDIGIRRNVRETVEALVRPLFTQLRNIKAARKEAEEPERRRTASEAEKKLDLAETYLVKGRKAYSDEDYTTAEKLYRDGITILTGIKDTGLEEEEFERKAKTLWETQVALVESIIKQGRSAVEEKKMITCMGNNIRDCEEEKERVRKLEVDARIARYIAKDEHGNPRNPPPSTEDFIREIHEKIRGYGGGNFRANYDQDDAANVVYKLTTHYLQGDAEMLRKLKKAYTQLSRNVSTYSFGKYSRDVKTLLHHDLYKDEILAGELFKIVIDLLELNYTYIPPTEQQPRQQPGQDTGWYEPQGYGYYRQTEPPEGLINQMVNELEVYIQILIAEQIDMSRFENIRQYMIDYLRVGHVSNQIREKAINDAVDRMHQKYRNKEGVFESVFEPPQEKMDELRSKLMELGLNKLPDNDLKSALQNTTDNDVKVALAMLTEQYFSGGSKRRRPKRRKTLKRTKKRKTEKRTKKRKTTKKKKKTRKKKKRSTKRKRR